MRIGITGEKGFIATNLATQIEKNNHTFVSIDNYTQNNSMYHKQETGETCVYLNDENDWYNLFTELKLDVIVHNAAVVGTDVVALNPNHAIMTNVLGTKNITTAANKAGILNVYIGTTVIYDTEKYQEEEITEESLINPKTDYAIQKYAAEMIVRNNSKEWLVMRPLFAYGGEGDMNSLISKSLYAIKNNIEEVDIFLNPSKIKDYMHVNDFCMSIIKAIDSEVRNEHFNVSAQNPYMTHEIISMIEEVTGHSLNKTIKWHEETDYLGNHRLTNKKYLDIIGYDFVSDLKEGIYNSWNSIKNANDTFNPLKHLQEAKEKNIDLTSHFPK